MGGYTGDLTGLVADCNTLLGLKDELRGTGITEYLRSGGTLETAARIAGHESTRTTQLYNRLPDEVSLDEIERIHI